MKEERNERTNERAKNEQTNERRNDRRNEQPNIYVYTCQHFTVGKKKRTNKQSQEWERKGSRKYSKDGSKEEDTSLIQVNLVTFSNLLR